MTYPQPYAAPLAPVDRIRAMYSRRAQTDYIFNFWTALGWTLLTCGIYLYYVEYKLVQRLQDHNQRRLEELNAARDFAWEQANLKEKSSELTPAFERVAGHLATMQSQKPVGLEPWFWLIILIFGGWIAAIVLYVLLDRDLIALDRTEGACEAELGEIFTQLGAPITPPDPARVKAPHNYGGRIVATLLTCGIYGFWWLYDLEMDGNKHFAQNRPWEDQLVQIVDQLNGTAAS